MRIQDSGIHCNADNTYTPCKPSAPAILTATATPLPRMTSPRLFRLLQLTLRPQLQLTHRPGWYLRIHRTEAGEPVPGALTYCRRARLHCPHCFRTFTHRMGLLGHMHLYDNLR
ncbi:unnamed protein product [Schistocephalus solidus]|uniref:C2H2-type domain-containing protein n=1 Tax=Schistocephalus solidus TaxID=70667 RepID=A0A183TLR0_SCHSO|nr:unnamed protein product [Schistocephalus solidus]